MDFNFDSLAKHPAVAGLAGSLTALRFIPGTSFMGRLANVFGGWCCAVFVGPLVFAWLGIDNRGSIAGYSYMLGMLGMAVADAVFRGIAAANVGDAINGVLRRIGGGGPPPSSGGTN